MEDERINVYCEKLETTVFYSGYYIYLALVMYITSNHVFIRV